MKACPWFFNAVNERERRDRRERSLAPLQALCPLPETPAFPAMTALLFLPGLHADSDVFLELFNLFRLAIA
jgi:hypothetical protein